MTHIAHQSPAGATAARWAVSVSERLAAIGLLIIGAILVAMAPLIMAQPFVMRPGIDGSLAVGVVGCLLALLHGIPYLRILRLLLPAAAVQVLCCLRFQISLPAYFGMEFIAWGTLGIAALVLQQRLGGSEAEPAGVETLS